MRRRIASDERNSDNTTSAPIFRQIWRKGASDTPAMGARMSGNECAEGKGNCMARKYLGITRVAMEPAALTRFVAAIRLRGHATQGLLQPRRHYPGPAGRFQGRGPG